MYGTGVGGTGLDGTAVGGTWIGDAVDATVRAATVASTWAATVACTLVVGAEGPQPLASSAKPTRITEPKRTTATTSPTFYYNAGI